MHASWWGAAAVRPPTGWRLDDRGKVDRSVVDAIEDVGEDGQGDRLALIIRSLRVMGPSFFTFRIRFRHRMLDTYAGTDPLFMPKTDDWPVGIRCRFAKSGT
jgi:hypothetical protein